MKTTFTYGENTLSPSSPRPILSGIPATKEKAKQHFAKLEQEILSQVIHSDSCSGGDSLFCDTKEPLFRVHSFDSYDSRATNSDYYSYNDAKHIVEKTVMLLTIIGECENDFSWHTPYYYCSPTCSRIFLLEAQRK